MEIETLLRENIAENLRTMKATAKDDEFYKQLVDTTTKLIDRAIDMEKINVEVEAKDKALDQERELKLKQLEEQSHIQEKEYDLKVKQLEEQAANRMDDGKIKRQQLGEDRKGRIVRDSISVAGIILPIAVTIWGTKKSFEFEKEGTITTIMGRGFLNKLLPKK